jgi:hypothetical protein
MHVRPYHCTTWVYAAAYCLPACLPACLHTSLRVQTLIYTAHAIVAFVDAGAQHQLPPPPPPPRGSLSSQQDWQEGMALALWDPPHDLHLTNPSVASGNIFSLSGASGRAAPMQAYSVAAAASGIQRRAMTG